MTKAHSGWVVFALMGASTVLADPPAPEHSVHGRIVDAKTGKLLPARLYVQRVGGGEFFFARSASAEGSAVPYDVARSPESVERHVTLSAHPFIVDLPSGRYRFTAERGKEYEAVSVEVDVPTAQPMELKLNRWVDMAARGWFSGDTHVHRSLEELPNVMLAEDLNVALPLSYWVRSAYTPPAQEDGSVAPEPKLIQVDRTHVVWPVNTEYELFTVNGRRHTLGAVFVLNHRSPLPQGAPPVGPVAEEARRQGAILDLDKHSWPWSLMLVPVMDVDLFELSNNHVWRTGFFFRQWTAGTLPEGWEIETDPRGWTERGWIDFGMKTYYALLNCGFKMRPTAGTASGVHPVPLGFGRVYVKLAEGFSYDGWMAGLDAGRSFVTAGPMLLATFDKKPPGETFLWADPGTMSVAGEVLSERPLRTIEIVCNGEVVRTVAPANREREAGGFASEFRDTVEVDGSSWLAVRCFEESEPGRAGRFAHTAPVRVDVDGKPLRPKRHEVRYFILRMEQELARNRDVLPADELAEYERALDAYRSLAERAE